MQLQFLPGPEPWVRLSFEGKVMLRPGNTPVWQLVLSLLGWESS